MLVFVKNAIYSKRICIQAENFCLQKFLLLSPTAFFDNSFRITFFASFSTVMLIFFKDQTSSFTVGTLKAKIRVQMAPKSFFYSFALSENVRINTRSSIFLR
jgi:hypothetical protein